MFVACCATGDDLCKDYSCKVEKTDKGLVITMEGNDQKAVDRLHAQLSNCCDEDKKDCC